jgi:hypothetical protein
MVSRGRNAATSPTIGIVTLGVPGERWRWDAPAAQEAIGRCIP